MRVCICPDDGKFYRQHCPVHGTLRVTPPVPAPTEPTVEWGVRWVLSQNDPQFTCRSREEAERECALWNEMHSDVPDAAPAAVVSRVVTSWQEVSRG